MNKEEFETLYNIIDSILDRAPVDDFKKTLRGLRYKHIEFTFSLDKDIIDCDGIVISGREQRYINSPTLRQKMIQIYNRC